MKKIIVLVSAITILGSNFLQSSPTRELAAITEINETLQTIDATLTNWEALDNNFMQDLKEALPKLVTAYYELVKQYESHPTPNKQEKIELIEKMLLETNRQLKSLETLLQTEDIQELDIQQTIDELKTLIYSANLIFNEKTKPQHTIRKWILGTTVAVTILILTIYLGKKVYTHFTQSSSSITISHPDPSAPPESPRERPPVEYPDLPPLVQEPGEET